MDKLNAIIVDDERPARKELIFLLKSFPEITIVGEADNLADATAQINKLKPDIVFLDIQLAGENGFELLEKIAIDFKVIFVTAFDAYAIKAFEVNATDYLLKPVDPARLEMTIKRIKTQALNSPSSNRKLEYNDSIYVSLNNNSAKFLELHTIILITSVGNYSKIETIESNDYVILKTLKQWEDVLPNNYFIRINRSMIVNIKYIIKIENYSKSHYQVYIKNKVAPFEISRHYYKFFKKVYK